MTTVAMIAGMTPVALGGGAGAESRQPMAVAIVGGLVSSTVLTLLVVPVVYSLFASVGATLARWLGGRRPPSAAAPGAGPPPPPTP
jgi:HAE1 family hydrophobic/amphiphilic exporter-1